MSDLCPHEEKRLRFKRDIFQDLNIPIDDSYADMVFSIVFKANKNYLEVYDKFCNAIKGKYGEVL